MDDKIIELIAAACHQQNKTYCELMNDATQPRWSDAPDWQKESAINGVRAAFINRDPERSHERWMEHKLANGWTYGMVKDAKAKTHPCLMPYSDLPPAQKIKDELFVSMVEELGALC